MNSDVNVITPLPQQLYESNDPNSNKCMVEGCDTVFSSASTLRLHMVKVHRIGSMEKLIPNNVVYACPIRGCPREASSKRYFKNISLLKRHFQCLHAKKKYTCCKCEKKFGYYWVFKKHEETCGKLYYCECGCYYSTLLALKQHCKRKDHNMKIDYDLDVKRNKTIKKKKLNVEKVNIPGYLIIPRTNEASETNNTIGKLSDLVAVTNVRTSRLMKLDNGLFEISPKLYSHQQNPVYDTKEKLLPNIEISISQIPASQVQSENQNVPISNSIICKEVKENNVAQKPLKQSDKSSQKVFKNNDKLSPPIEKFKRKSRFDTLFEYLQSEKTKKILQNKELIQQVLLRSKSIPRFQNTLHQVTSFQHLQNAKKSSSYQYEDLNISPRQLADMCTQTMVTFSGIDEKFKLNREKSIIVENEDKQKMQKAKQNLKPSHSTQCTIMQNSDKSDNEVQTDDNFSLSWLDHIDYDTTFSNIETQTMPVTDLLNSKSWNYDELLDIGTQTNPNTNFVNTRYDSSVNNSTQTSNLIDQLLSADSSNIATQTNGFQVPCDTDNDHDFMFDVHFNVAKENNETPTDCGTQTFESENDLNHSATQTKFGDFQDLYDKFDYSSIMGNSSMQNHYKNILCENSSQSNSIMQNATNTLSTQTNYTNEFIFERLPENVKNDIQILDNLLHLPSESNDFATQTFAEELNLCSSGTQTLTDKFDFKDTLQNDMETQTILSLNDLFSDSTSCFSNMIGKDLNTAETQTLYCEENFNLI